MYEVGSVWQEHISVCPVEGTIGVKKKVRIICASPPLPLAPIIESTLQFQQYFTNLQNGPATESA
jgi:hypothetical protein